MSMFRLFISTFSVKILGALCSLILTYAVSQTLNPSDAGDFFALLSLLMLTAQFARLGADNALLRFLSSANICQASKNGLFIAYLILAIILAPAIYVLLYFLFFSDAPIGDELTFLNSIKFVAAAVCVAFTFLTAIWIQARRHYSFALLLKGPAQNIFLALTIFALAFSATPITSAISLIWILGSVYFFIILCVFSTFRSENFSCPSNQILLSSGKASLNLAGIAFVTASLQWMAPIFVAQVSSSESVAIFSVSQRLVAVVGFFLIAVNHVAAPNFGELFSLNKFREAERIFWIATGSSAVVSIIIFLALIVFGTNILSFFGEKYSSGYLFLIALGIGQLVNSVTGPVNNVLVMSGNEHVVRNNILISGGIFFFGSYWLSGFYGAIGVAIATACSLSTTNILGFIFAVRLLRTNRHTSKPNINKTGPP